jgi:hypothetical protein
MLALFQIPVMTAPHCRPYEAPPLFPLVSRQGPASLLWPIARTREVLARTLVCLGKPVPGSLDQIRLGTPPIFYEVH